MEITNPIRCKGKKRVEGLLVNDPRLREDYELKP